MCNASVISSESTLPKNALLKTNHLGKDVPSKSVKNVVLELMTEALQVFAFRKLTLLLLH